MPTALGFAWFINPESLDTGTYALLDVFGYFYGQAQGGAVSEVPHYSQPHNLVVACCSVDGPGLQVLMYA